MVKRITKKEHYMKIAEQVSKRSSCYRRHIGALIVKNDQMISTGYIGSPRKTKDCFEHGFCLRSKMEIPHGQRYELCRSVHAEQNAIINAARSGTNLMGGDMYIYGEDPDGTAVDVFPCFICKKMIINAGLKNVHCMNSKGNILSFRVSDWIEDWMKGDIIDDKHQYGKSNGNSSD